MQFKEAIDQFSGWRKFKVKIQTVRATIRRSGSFVFFYEIQRLRISVSIMKWTI